MSVYRPTPEQALVKARIHASMRDTPWIDATALSALELAARADEPKLKTWLSDPEFRRWFMDPATVQAKIAASLEAAVDALYGIVTETDVGPGGRVTAASIVKAAEVLAKLGDLFPTQRPQVVFADKDLLKLDESALDKQIDQYERRRQLGAATKPESST